MSIVLKAKTEKKLVQKIEWPQNRVFLSIEIKTLENLSSYFSFVLALKIIDTHYTIVIFICNFENAQKNHYQQPKTAKMAFLTVNNFFCAF